MVSEENHATTREQSRISFLCFLVGNVAGSTLRSLMPSVLGRPKRLSVYAVLHRSITHTGMACKVGFNLVTTTHPREARASPLFAESTRVHLIRFHLLQIKRSVKGQARRQAAL
jgi:hypothetical protein